MANSFWGGFFKETTEILKEADDRNFKLINSALEYQSKDISTRRSARKKAEEEYRVLAENLKDLGLSKNQINVVLRKGPEKATKFLTEAPEYAAKQNLTPADYVELADPDGEDISPTELMAAGLLPGLEDVGGFFKPAGLSSAYQQQYERRAEFLSGVMGLDQGEKADTTVSVPQGSIRWQDMLAEKPESRDFKLSAGQYNNQTSDFFVLASGLEAETKINPDGTTRLALSGEKTDTQFLINNLQMRTRTKMNELANMYKDVGVERIYQLALDEVVQEMSEQEIKQFPRLKMYMNQQGGGAGQAGSTQAPQQKQQTQQATVKAQIDQIDADAKLTPAIKAARKRLVLINAGIAMTPKEADQLLKSGQY